MTGTLNKALLIGHLGQDPDIRTMNSGELVAHLSVATSESWKNKSTGARRDATEWHRVVLYTFSKRCQKSLASIDSMDVK